MGSQAGRSCGIVAARMIARKPRMLVAIALANRIARVAWCQRAPKFPQKWALKIPSVGGDSFEMGDQP